MYFNYKTTLTRVHYLSFISLNENCLGKIQDIAVLGTQSCKIIAIHGLAASNGVLYQSVDRSFIEEQRNGEKKHAELRIPHALV